MNKKRPGGTKNDQKTSQGDLKMNKKRPKGTKNEQKTSQWDDFWSNTCFFWSNACVIPELSKVFFEQCIEMQGS